MQPRENADAIHHVALLGNYLPRHCGIATFTTDLTEAIRREFPQVACRVVAMNDGGQRHAYGERVRFEIPETDLAAYRRAADFLNVSATEVLCLQHEYGIFGGKAGSHVLALLRELRMPIVTTLHTILSEPTPDQRRVMDEVLRLSSRVIPMSQHGAELLREIHGLSASKIDVIPHGIPSVVSTPGSKARLGLEDKVVLLTFGLLSPDKGIEFVIDALPGVVKRHPTVVYVVLGATHPHVKDRHGEAYRSSLELRARALGVDAHLIFFDRFVTAEELNEFLAAADIYITPYLNLEQSTSGTLAYAIGAGKAVISTPYRYARELLADGRGVLVPERNSAAIADVLGRLLSEPEELNSLRAQALAHGRGMVWPAVARQYLTSMGQALREHTSARRTRFEAKTVAERPLALPDLQLSHLRAMSDDTGLLQHAAFNLPRYEDGYCIDDNARGLLLMTLAVDAGTASRAIARPLADRYLAFVSHAFNAKLGRFRNFMTYSRRFTEELGSEDSHGRALWALGAVLGRSTEPGTPSLSGQLFHAALPAALAFESHRGVAFALLGIAEYLRAFRGESGVEALQRSLAAKLLSRFQSSTAQDWPWCEDILTYDNPRLPQALIVSGVSLEDREMVETGLSSLRWLCTLQCAPEGYFDPIGANGFYPRGGRRAHFDQQPLEACATISASLEAWRVSTDPRWPVEMRRAFRWFLGDNALKLPLYDPSTGGCRDGLHPDRPNENQGAESTLSFLLARTELGLLEEELRLRGGPAMVGTVEPRVTAEA